MSKRVSKLSLAIVVLLLVALGGAVASLATSQAPESDASATGTYFAVIDAVVTDRGEHDIAVQVEPIDPASYRISIQGTAGARGALKGEVRVRTDVPGEEDLPIRLFGYVK